MRVCSIIYSDNRVFFYSLGIQTYKIISNESCYVEEIPVEKVKPEFVPRDNHTDFLLSLIKYSVSKTQAK